MLNETTLYDWFLVTFTDVPAPNQVLWGTVGEDLSFRWYPSDWCCTSLILEMSSGNVMITKNTKYTLQGPGQRVELPVKALIELRQGVDPVQWLALQELSNQGFRVEIEPEHR